MTYSDEIAKPSSERNYLVRIDNSTDLSLTADVVGIIAGGVKCRVPNDYIYVASIVRHGNTLTYSATATDTIDYWYYDAGFVYLNSPTIPNVSTNIIILNHGLFYTNGIQDYYYPDPTAPSGTKVLFKSYMLNDPKIRESIKNVFHGQLSLSSISIKLSDHEDELLNLCKINDSFNRQPVFVWSEVNGEINLKYSGNIVGLSIGENTVDFSVNSKFESLFEPAYMRDDTDRAFFNKTWLADLYPDDDGRPLPYIFNNSPFGFVESKTLQYNNSVGSYLKGRTHTIDESKCFRSACFDYSFGPASRNDYWMLCRTSSLGYKTLDFGTMTTAYVNDSGGSPERIEGNGLSTSPIFVATTGHNIKVGDSFRVTRSATDYYVLVMTSDASGFMGMITRNNGNNYASGTNDNFIGATFHTNKGPALVITDNQGNRYFPNYYRDFEVFFSTMTSGNEIMYVRLDVGIAGSLNMTTAVDPSLHSISFRATENESADSSDTNVVKTIVELATGVTTTTGSTTSDVSFSIPSLEETDYRNYSSYIEKIFESTFGYLALTQNSSNFIYDKISVQSSTDERDSINIIGSFSIKIEYKDIVSEIRFKNKYYDVAGAVADSTVTVSSNRARYLHNVSKSKDFEHVLTDMTSRSSDILKILSTRFAEYTFDTSSIDLDLIVGQPRNMTFERSLPKTTGNNIFVTSISSSNKKTTVSGNDLGEL